MGVILIGYFNVNFVWLGKGEFLINDDIGVTFKIFNVFL
jgi:hypothetical protein